MDKKIGILTFHYGINFGGVLQCLALQNYLLSIGYDVEVINYTPSNFRLPSPVNPLFYYHKPYSNIIRFSFIKLFYGFRQIANFKRFKANNLRYSNEKYNEFTIGTLKDKYGAIIVGSDQVWGPAQHNVDTFFLDFDAGNSCRKISYAPCCAINSVGIDNKEKLSTALNDFYAISARNTTTSDFVEKLIFKRPQLVVDPTLLYDFKEFSSTTKYEEDYALVYILGEMINGGHQAIIERIKNEYGSLKIYAVMLSINHPKQFTWADKIFYTADPQQWIELIANSKVVYTDSFHGLIFAMKYRKQFIAYYAEENRKSRFTDLQERYGLADFIVSSVEDADRKQTISKRVEYARIDKIIEEQSSISKEYLKTALKW